MTASPDPLDGPERRRRRVRLASRSKVAFHDREGDQDRDARGHKLWRGDALLHGWGSSQLTQDQPDQP